jgi:hypothetical protein
VISEPLDKAGIGTVAAIPNPILRNLWITQSYFELNTRLQRAVGGEDRTWCGFAVWASDTAGMSIRGEELPHLVVQLTDQSPDHLDDVASVNRRLRPLRAVRASEPVSDDPLQRAVHAALADVSEHIAHGNTLVYTELGPLLVAFVERCETADPTTMTSDEVASLLAHAAGGEALDPELVQAFEWWRTAVVSTDDQLRAFAVLAANVLAVAHEQRRLQPDIAAAMNVGLLTAAGIIHQVTPRWFPRWLERLVAKLVGKPLTRVATRLWQQTTTELLMTLRVPGAVLRLHHDVPLLPDGQRFPTVLAELLDAPDEIASAVAVYRTWDRTGGSGDRSGAGDWAVLDERMSYIVNLFRGRQRDTSFDVHPFTADQLSEMRAGRVPDGPLLPPGPSAP